MVDEKGQPVTDPEQAFRHVFNQPEGGITPLGGAREVGGHKGYGLAVMVHILAGTLSGASFSPIRNRTQKPSDPHNIGHFFLAIDPRAFRDAGLFEDDLDQVLDYLSGGGGHRGSKLDRDVYSRVGGTAVPASLSSTAQ